MDVRYYTFLYVHLKKCMHVRGGRPSEFFKFLFCLSIRYFKQCLSECNFYKMLGKVKAVQNLNLFSTILNCGKESFFEERLIQQKSSKLL